MNRAPLGALLLSVAFGCAHVQRVEGLEQKLEAAPGGYVKGKVSGLERAALLDNKDFVYGIALSPAGDRAAFTHLAGKTFNLGVWSLRPEPEKRVVDVPICDYEFDVEGIDFSPDGQTVVTAGRDGVVRFWSATTGAKVGELFADEPLVSVAFLPSGKQVVAGSARGLLTLLSWPNPAWLSDVRAHTDEVRAIAVAPEGRIVTGGWDKTIAVFQVEEAPVSATEARLSFGRLSRANPAPVVHAGVDRKMGVFLYDAAQPLVVVTSELARAVGIDPSLLTQTQKLPNGVEARVSPGHTVQLKQLQVEGVDLAVCDACVPKGAHGILGAAVLGKFEVTSNPAVGELVLVARNPPDATNLPTTPTLRQVKRHTMPAFVNDLSIDRVGARVGVAFSHEKAERNREVYQREKRGEPAPKHAEDVAAIVRLEDGSIEHQWSHHVGVVSTAAISPDGQTVVSGGWDKLLIVQDVTSDKQISQQKFGWSLRRVRFSRDGSQVAVGAWTPQNAVGNQASDPSAVLYDVVYTAADVVSP